MKYEKIFRKGRKVLWTKTRWVTDHNGLEGQGKDLGDFCEDRKPLGRSHTPLVSRVQLSGRLAVSRSGGREIHCCGQGWALR